MPRDFLQLTIHDTWRLRELNGPCGQRDTFREISECITFARPAALRRSKRRDATELAGAVNVRKKASDCVSKISIALYISEIGFLEDLL